MAMPGTISSRVADIQLMEQEFESDSLRSLWEEEMARKEVVLYVTSLEAVRQTINDCRAAQRIFATLGLRVWVKDIYLEPQYSRELAERLPGAGVPQAFVGFESVGSLDELVRRTDDGSLKALCAGYAQVEPTELLCRDCGGARFITCRWCQGTRKSTVHQFGKSPAKLGAAAGGVLLCTICNKNGLEPCPSCGDTAAIGSSATAAALAAAAAGPSAPPKPLQSFRVHKRGELGTKLAVPKKRDRPNLVFAAEDTVTAWPYQRRAAAIATATATIATELPPKPDDPKHGSGAAGVAPTYVANDVDDGEDELENGSTRLPPKPGEMVRSTTSEVLYNADAPDEVCGEDETVEEVTTGFAEYLSSDAFAEP